MADLRNVTGLPNGSPIIATIRARNTEGYGLDSSDSNNDIIVRSEPIT